MPIEYTHNYRESVGGLSFCNTHIEKINKIEQVFTTSHTYEI